MKPKEVAFLILVHKHAFLILVHKHAFLILVHEHAFLILVHKHAFLILVHKHAFLILVHKIKTGGATKSQVVTAISQEFDIFLLFKCTECYNIFLCFSHPSAFNLNMIKFNYD